MRQFLAPLFALAASALVVGHVQAQTTVTGQVDARAGLGSATPYGGGVSLQVKAPKLLFAPSLTVEGITRRSSSATEDLTYHYASSGHDYLSTQETSSRGYRLLYGAALTYDLAERTQLKLALTGSHSDEDRQGTRFEQLSALADKSLFASALAWPSLRRDRLGLDASLLRQMRRPGESLLLQYTFRRAADDQTLQQDVAAQSSLVAPRFTANRVEQQGVTLNHTVLLDWKRPLTPRQSVELGARYDHIGLTSDDHQQLDRQTTLAAHFSHLTHTAAAFVAYSARVSSLSANVRMEYDYTRQDGRTLHDFVPTASLRWQATAASSLTAAYVRRIVRPGLEYLNPARIVGLYTLDYGTPTLEGIHLNNLSLVYQHKRQAVDFTTTLSHIFVEDGFNAIWMEKDDVRISFWGNEGVRRAWSLSPSVKWTVSPLTTLTAQAQLLWDKRVARAIHMAKEHWGVTTRAELQQRLPLGLGLTLRGGYTEGNTVDLYSHEGRSYDYGLALRRAFLAGERLQLRLSYDYHDYATIILTQGQYTGRVSRQPADQFALSAQVTYRF